MIRRLAVALALAVFAGGAVTMALPKLSGGDPTPLARAAAKQEMSRLVLLITVDALRADALSCYGNQRISTPAVDGLASQGVLFSRAVSPGTWTLPSVGSIMAGVSPLVSDVSYATPLPASIPTLAERMRDAGYTTVAVVGNPLIKPFHLDRGFGEFEEWLDGPAGPGMAEFVRNDSIGSRVLERTGTPRTLPSADSDRLTDATLRLIAKHRGRNLFVWVHYMDAHDPYKPPGKFRPAGPPPGGLGWEVDPSKVLPRSAAEEMWIRRLYEGDVAHVDEAIGRLLAGARGHGETMVVLTADHGEGFLEHGSITHGNGLYSELLSVPLIVKPFHPATAGVKEAALVSTQQIAATILDACGLPDTPALPMASALPLSGAAVGGPVVTLGSYGEYAIGVTFGHYRYVYAPPSEREELYDLDADPGERFSLIRSVPEVRAEGLRLVRSAVADAESWRARLGIKAVRPAAMDEDTLRRLKALGYVQ